LLHRRIGAVLRRPHRLHLPDLAVSGISASAAARRRSRLLNTYRGGCHCGRIAFQVTADLGTVTDCNCSMCTKKGFLHLIVPPDRFRLLRGDQASTTYAFNTGVARHLFCATCGIHAYYIPRSDPDKIDVNARCLDDVDVAALRPIPFDGRHWEQAIQTRNPLI
jgi:hypothetical protein